jgi:CubicO group peptidase (beta-lactamase class C family)
MKLAAILLASITGLWAGRRNFGPDVHGPLQIESDGHHYVAEIAGRTSPVTIEHDKVRFELPNHEGSFRGAIRGERIVGHWVQSNNFATPVTLTKRSPSRWSGIATPLDDHMTFYMPVTANADGSFSAFLRNPERNLGRFIDVQHIKVDGDRVTLLGKDDKVLVEGKYDAANDAISIVVNGATFDLHRATPADETAFYPRGKTPPRYIYRKPPQRDDGWPVGTLEEAGLSRDAMTKFIEKLMAMPVDSVHSSEIHGVLIARHGKLVLEEYFHGTNPDEPHDTRSAAKSLTSVLVGAAKLSASTHVYAAMGEHPDDPRKQALTVEHLLTMSSGLDCDDNDDNSPGREDTMQEQTAQPDWYQFTLDLKMIRNPGEKSVYCSCQPNLAGGVLQRKSGRWLPDLFRDLVAEPLQIRNYAMNLTPTGDAYMGGGVRFPPRDFMKLGQLIIDGGKWHGRQTVSAEWAKRSTSPLTQIGDGKYGYLWWLADYPYHGKTVRAFYAGGNGGQIVMGIPELDLVIAFYGGNYSDRVMFVPQRELVPQDILPAIKE